VIDLKALTMGQTRAVLGLLLQTSQEFGPIDVQASESVLSIVVPVSVDRDERQAAAVWIEGPFAGELLTVEGVRMKEIAAGFYPRLRA